ncbi:M48 family metallopeptidase [Erythrobacter sp.]|uniref:M48 family metallopeptidase n=1 Tax=Erythrobacter sp. TaxID=1042 RepID=UPI001425C7B8|nr:SprT family zinc-dependent metalloprotease [Erythrobacter sp.]QIQ87012.1 MAG: M48 family metallopeptidase [Erythrobacter sp.]
MIDWLRRAAIDPEIELNGERVPIVLRQHARARRLTLRLAPDGSEVRLTVPHWAPRAQAIAFAHARADWLAQQHAKIPRRMTPGPGTEILLRGAPLRVEWDERAPRTPRATDGNLRVGGSLSGLEGRLRRWLEREALALFEADMRDYCAAAGLEPVPVALSRAQRRWGSCSDRSRIRINWRLVQAPDFVRRSVVAHEVAHLVHFDHSPAFHALLANIYEDDIASADRWLRQRGRSLYAAFG